MRCRTNDVEIGRILIIYTEEALITIIGRFHHHCSPIVWNVFYTHSFNTQSVSCLYLLYLLNFNDYNSLRDIDKAIKTPYNSTDNVHNQKKILGDHFLAMGIGVLEGKFAIVDDKSSSSDILLRCHRKIPHSQSWISHPHSRELNSPIGTHTPNPPKRRLRFCRQAIPINGYPTNHHQPMPIIFICK